MNRRRLILSLVGVVAVVTIVIGVVLWRSDSAPAEEVDGQVVLHDDVRIIEDPGEITSYDFDSGELVTTFTPDVGEVLVAGITPGTPEGLMVRVQEATGDGTVLTEPAALTEVIASTGGPLVVDGVAEVVEAGAEPGVTYRPNVTAGGGAGTYSPLFSGELAHKWEFEKRVGTVANMPATVKGSAEVGLNAEMDLDISLFRGLQHFDASVTPKAEASLELEVGKAFEWKVDEKVGFLKHRWTFSIGPVPVVMSTEFNVGVKADGGVATSTVVSTGASADATLGYRWEDGEGRTYSDSNAHATPPELTTDGPEVTTSLDASVSGGLTAKFYEVLGLRGSVGPYSAIEVTWPQMECTWDAGLRGQVETSVEFPSLFGKARASATVALLDKPFREDVACRGWEPPAAEPLEITPEDVATQIERQDWQVGRAMTAVTVGTSGGVSGSASLSVEGDLPPGVEFTSRPDGGRVEGTPSGEGTFEFMLVAVDGEERTEVAVRVVVAPEPEPVDPLTPVATDGVAAPIGHEWGMPIAFSGGRAPYTVEVVGDLPPGLRFERWGPDSFWLNRHEDDPGIVQVTVGGDITGVPTELGEWPVTIRVTDADGSVVEVPYTVPIIPVPPEGWPPPVF